MTEKEIRELFEWAMTDQEWRAAGCPTPGSVNYAIAAASLRPDGGKTYRDLWRYLHGKDDHLTKEGR